MKSYVISAWRSGLRGRSFQAVFLLGVMLIAGAYLAAMFSPRQPETVALDVGLSGVRFATVLLAIFWVQELVGKEIENRTTSLYLSYPIPRTHYMIGKFAGIALLLLVAMIIFGLMLWLAVMLSSELYTQAHPVALGRPYWAAVFGLWLDGIVVTAFALCVASLSTTPSLPLALGVAFAIAGHSLGAVIDYFARGADGRQDLITHYGPIIDVSRWLLPDLSRLDWRVWPMYDLPLPSGTIPLACLMALGYTGVMLSLAAHCFRHREFD